MRRPLDSRVNALFNPRLVCVRFDCALIDARLLTTENEAMERFLLESRAASLRPVAARAARVGEVIGNRFLFFNGLGEANTKERQKAEGRRQKRENKRPNRPGSCLLPSAI